MDTLGYGINNPQLALMNNGQVFVSGQVVGNSNSQSRAQAQTPSQGEGAMAFGGGIKPMSDGGATTLAGDEITGVIGNWHSPVTITWHFVAPPLLYEHTAIRITPANQSKWKNDPFYGGLFIQDAPNAPYYITLSAAPASNADALAGLPTMLVRFFDRDTDVHHQTGFKRANFTCSSQDREDAMIQMFLTAFLKYKNNINYTLIPTDGESEYNSNSFTHGLINAIGLGSCVDAIDTSCPGWDNPLPAACFGY